MGTILDVMVAKSHSGVGGLWHPITDGRYQHELEARRVLDALQLAVEADTWRALDTGEVIDRFNAAFNAHDVDAVMALMTEDAVFESTLPAPDGRRYEGQAAVRAYWEEFFASSPPDSFAGEETIVTGDRAVVRWVFNWGTGHVRGVDVMTVRDGKVAEKLSYVKG